jgi:GxxExxY protein
MQAERDLITGEIIGSAMRIHRELGSGMFENVYKLLLGDDLVRKGLDVQTEVAFPLVFEGRCFEKGFKVDLLVAHSVVIEVKCARTFAPEHFKQVLTYIKILKMPVGLLLNFGASSLGIRRFLNDL